MSNLRRLAADHAMLHSTELPPCYLFPQSNSGPSIEDLTQLIILITGPTGTPYSQGLWKLSLKIPESYPKAPPKAAFRTRIWHPNVDENTGSICVDTLKKDWQPNLTLRDVLITIYCLLIQPNPNSALNATAGHLLQDDYDSFARQARLMTSIHARIPSDLELLALSARKRGEAAGTAVGEDTQRSPTWKSKAVSSRPDFSTRKPPDYVPHAPSASSTLDDALHGESPTSEGISASKENDPLLSLSPVPVPSPRRSSTAKRPLSDLYIMEPEYDMTSTPCLGSSEQNIVNNVLPPTKVAPSNSSQKGLQIEDQSGHGQATQGSSTASDDLGGKSNKKVCSDSGKENILETWEARSANETPVPAIYAATRFELSTSRRTSTSNAFSTSRGKGKSRVGLRRL